jgi:hypothetical protein
VCEHDAANRHAANPSAWHSAVARCCCCGIRCRVTQQSSTLRAREGWKDSQHSFSCFTADTPDPCPSHAHTAAGLGSFLHRWGDQEVLSGAVACVQPVSRKLLRGYQQQGGKIVPFAL